MCPAHPAAATWRDRVEAADWDAVRADLERYGCGLIGRLLTAGEAARDRRALRRRLPLRSTVNMGRYRFGEGEYRYFTPPFPDAVAGLRQALYPKLLPIARTWWTRLGQARPVAGQPAGVAGDVPRRRAGQAHADSARRVETDEPST